LEELRIEGGARLKGSVTVSGSKNAALPALAAAVLTGGAVLRRVPRLADIDTMCELLECLGCRVVRRGHTLRVSADDPSRTEAPYEIVSRMRASICVLGPLLAARGHARVALPGGCAIGLRPVDLHLKGMEALGASISVEHGYIVARARRLKGAHVRLAGRFGPSVLATANTMMAATLADGRSVIEPAAQEPEVVDLAAFLRGCGARITGAGTPRIEIEGVSALRAAEHTVIADRIEAGTYLLAAAATRSEVTVTRCRPKHLAALVGALREAGFHVDGADGAVTVAPGGRRTRPLNVVTAPYPGFPTDLQPQTMALLSGADGTSTITETVFPQRFTHAAELARMGARITQEGATAVVEGVGRLHGTEVEASDLRAGAALVVAALSAEGVSRVRGLEHIDRGYEDLEGKLSSLGARITRSAV